MHELIKNYEEAKRAIYDHVGFGEESWVVCPIEDCTEYVWKINTPLVTFAENLEELEDVEAGKYYQDEIYTQRFYDKWVYEGKDLTMVFCNPDVDGMKWFRLFDNSKRIGG